MLLSKLPIRSVLVVQVLNHGDWNQQEWDGHKRTEKEGDLHHVLKRCTHKDIGVCLD